MPITRLFLIRHGETTLSSENRFSGERDIPLSDHGREQARRLGHRLHHVRIAAFYASPLARTLETAALIAEPHGQPVLPRPGLQEISHGHWEGLTRAEVDHLYPIEAAAWEEDPFTFAPRGGESGLAVTARALPVLLEIARAHSGETVAVVSHKATIRLLLSSLLGFDPRRYRDNLDLDPASLTIVDFRDSVHARLALYNDTSHYDEASGLAIPAPASARLSRWWSGGGGNVSSAPDR